jgi:DNA-binding CsgD family transcriptional regulator
MPGRVSLTEREEEIPALLSTGSSYEQVAQIACLSLNTVKTHVRRIYAKAGVNNKVEASR